MIAHGGGQYNTLGVLMLGIGTLLDSMLAIRKRVYEDRSMSLKELTVRTLNNAPGSKNDYPCFGKPEPEIEGLAHYVSGEICRHLLGITLPDGTKLSPSYFLFGADIMKDYPATPDGRLNGERVSYGCMPSEWHDLSLTERLRAAAQITHDLTPNGSPAMLSFSKDLLTPDKVKALIQGYFELGGSHLHLNLQDKESLKEARIHPEEHRELLVRVSGYSAPFVSMPDRWQQALIERMD